MRNVFIIALAGTTVGLISIALGYIELGASMCSATITGYFGYSRQQRNSSNSYQTILALYVNLIVLLFLLWHPDRDTVAQAMSLAMSVLTGYLGFSQQSTKEDNKNGLQ